MTRVWSAERAQAYFAGRPWLVGCNYIAAYAANQIEFWAAETFDPLAIGRELDWAKGLGFNSLRVYLHDLCYAADGEAYFNRIDKFLSLADQRGISTLLVIFDSCWHPFPRLGRQIEPEPGVHNSGWVQSPGVAVLRESARFAQLEPYLRGLARRFGRDPRIVAWDVWNEPDNQNIASRYTRDLMEEKPEIVRPLLEQAFAWMRAEAPEQPLTCGLWTGEWTEAGMTPLMRLQAELSDVISFHWYGSLEEARDRAAQLRRYGRPLLCTEYLARPRGNCFENFLPWFKAEGIGAYNWGLVKGRTQTHLPWSTWQNPAEHDPDPWFHDILHPDGTAWSEAEVATIRKVTGV